MKCQNLFSCKKKMENIIKLSFAEFAQNGKGQTGCLIQLTGRLVNKALYWDGFSYSLI